MTSSQVKRDSLVDAVIRQIRMEVVCGDYPPGGLLPPEREMAERYGVTRATLKHALVRLVQAGLLETRHGVGTRVRDFERSGSMDLLPWIVDNANPDWLGDVFVARQEIGALTAGRAAVHATAEDRRRLVELLEEIRSAKDAETVQLVECEIHRQLAAASGNRVYALLVNGLLNAYLQVKGMFLVSFASPRTVAARLEPVIDAVVDGDAAAARAASEEYLRVTGREMLGRDT